MVRLFVSLFISIFLLISCVQDKTKSASDSTLPQEQSQSTNNGSAIPIVSAEEAVNIPNALFLDVRRKDELEGGVVPTSIHIDYQSDNFKEELKKLDKDRTYIVYCRSGQRSTKASEMMIDLGFGSVINMVGGYNEYQVTHP